MYPVCHNFNGADFCAPNSCAGIIQSCEIHDEGQLWCATLWEMRAALIAEVGQPLADEIALTLVTDGLKFTPCEPTFLDARDAILMADMLDYAGAYHCLIWQAFADRMMGYGASTVDMVDRTPVGSPDLPPECLTQGRVNLSLDAYGCDEDLVITVADGNQPTAPSVSVTTSIGDNETFPTVGTGPVFSTGPVPLLGGVSTPSQPGVIEVDAGGTFTVTYSDPDVGDVTAQASVDCVADVSVQYLAPEGGCDDDAHPDWPVALPEILDAGENITINLAVTNHMDRDIQDAQVTMVDTGSSFVAVVGPSTVDTSPTTIERVTNTAAGMPSYASFTLAASNLATSGVITLDLQVTGRGYTSTTTPISIDIPLHMDYQPVLESTPLYSWEADEEGWVSYAWPGNPIDAWGRSDCAASDGTWAFRAGDPDCSSLAPETDANLESPLISPYSMPLRPSFYPVEIRWQHQLEIDDSPTDPLEEVIVAASNPDFLDTNAVIWDNYAEFFGADNTAGVFAPQSLAFSPDDLFRNELDVSKGLIFWFDFWSISGTGTSFEWVVDEVQMDYMVAEAQPQTDRVCSVGYHGTTACSAGQPWLYNRQRVDEAQFAGDGVFWEISPDWNMLDGEFPTPSAAGEYLGLVVSYNPDDTSHQGQAALNGRRITAAGAEINFGGSPCEPIPTPIGPSAAVPEGQPILLQWDAMAESGTTDLVAGYNVYRLFGETWDAATSTIDDYLTNGVLVGNTAGQGNINQFTDTAPTLVTAPQDTYWYAIQPLLACDDPGVGSCSANGTFPLHFNNAEGNVLGGQANLSTDSRVGNLVSNSQGPVRVGEDLLAVYGSYQAERTSYGTVKVSWDTLAEIDTLGYYVYWGSSPDQNSLTRAGNQLIRAQGAGSLYIFETDLPEGVSYFQVRELALVGEPSRTPVFSLEQPQGTRSGSARRTRSGASRGTADKAAEDDGGGRLRRRR
jgi:hypothetical protein